MRPIHNPFRALPGYNCFACSPDNDRGLKMSFREVGEEIQCDWEPLPGFTGYGSILHGGIQATMHDEIAAWFVYVKLLTAGVTKRLEVDFQNPVELGAGAIRIAARLEGFDNGLARIKTTLHTQSGKLGSEALAVYFLFPQHIAKKKLSYPADPGLFFKG